MPRSSSEHPEQMPALFKISKRLFGKAMMNRQGPTRIRLEKLLARWCRVTREKHSLRTRRRSLICQCIL